MTGYGELFDKATSEADETVKAYLTYTAQSATEVIEAVSRGTAEGLTAYQMIRLRAFVMASIMMAVKELYGVEMEP